MQTYEILENARDLLVKGWVARVRKSGNNYCALGAIDYSGAFGIYGIHGGADDFSAHKACVDALCEEISAEAKAESGCGGNHNGHLIAWYSNTKGQEMTVELFNKAIRAEKARIGTEIRIPEESLVSI